MTRETLGGVLDLEVTSTCEYSSRPRRRHTGAVFGGQLLGQAVIAAGRSVDARMRARSLHARFDVPGDPTRPIDYLVTAVDERASSTRCRVTAWQSAVRIFTAEVLFGFNDCQAESGTGTGVPGAESRWTVDDAPDLRREIEPWLNALRQVLLVDIAFLDEPAPVAVLRTGTAPADQRFLVRPADDLPDDTVTRAAAIAYMSDVFLLAGALGPRGLRMADRHVRAVSIDHTMWFHQLPPAGSWMQHRTSVVRNTTDLALCRAEIIGPSGTATADVMQQGLIRVRPPR